MAEDFREIPRTTYEHDIERIVGYYKSSIESILRELDRLDVSNITQANSRATIASIAKILSELNEEAAAWVDEMVPIAARDGAAGTLYALGLAETMEQAVTIVAFNQINKHMVETAIADMQTDLLAITHNVDRKVRTAVRQVVAEVMRSNMTQGINGRRTISREILGGLRNRLGDSVNTGIIDAAGRRWDPKVYAETVARTKLMDTQREAMTNEALGRGAYYGVVSSAPAKDACSYHLGRIVKLTADAPGSYPTVQQLRASHQIFHPNCRHHITPLRDPSLLPQTVREKAAQQAELGDKALATGKRNPKDVE